VWRLYETLLINAVCWIDRTIMNIKTNFVAFVKVKVVTVPEITSLYKVHRPYLRRLSGGVLVCKVYRDIQGTFTYICQA
jgi:hypothetical protein